MAKAPPRDLAAELAKPSFTPGKRDIDGLIALVAAGDEPASSRATLALGKLDALAATRAALAATTVEAARARLASVIGLFARGGNGDALDATLALVGDPLVRVRRAAIASLGKLTAPGHRVRDALIARWDAADLPPDERRTLAEALGKLGGPDVQKRLAALATGDDAELARRRDRALLMAEREARRDEVSAIRDDVAPPQPLAIRLGTRDGLGPLLGEELVACGILPTKTDRDHATVRLAAPLATLFASRLWATLAIEIPFATQLSQQDLHGRARADRVADPARLAAALVDAIASPPVRGLLEAWTRGPIRWRLGFAQGHKRAIVWSVARDVTARAPELVNDPTATTWDFVVDDEVGTLVLVPKKLADPRFAWRVADVPAASHPSVAAALARVAQARPGDRVWDPFCGSAAELIERACLGPTKALVGTDTDEAALVAARQNLAAADLASHVTLALGDARTFGDSHVDLIITNPPLGSRVRVDAASLLCEALPHWRRRLAPGGRLVWITPATRRTTPVAESLGLRRTTSFAVDLGGVRGQLERWDTR